MDQRQIDLIIEKYLNDLAKANHERILAQAQVQILQETVTSLQQRVTSLQDSKGVDGVTDLEPAAGLDS